MIFKTLFSETCFIFYQVVRIVISKGYKTLLDEIKDYVLSSIKDEIPLKSKLLLEKLINYICFQFEYANLQKMMIELSCSVIFTMGYNSYFIVKQSRQANLYS